MYTISHFEEDQLQVTRLRSFVRAGNTLYVLSTARRDFLIPVQQLDDDSLIALTKVEEGSWMNYTPPNSDELG